ncbi:hypothetical protein cypCar_00009903 [Cyprinus carpio]|nr:hypothetical protein cypCar_00009903 [Cyprinus carpio]
MSFPKCKDVTRSINTKETTHERLRICLGLHSRGILRLVGFPLSHLYGLRLKVLALRVRDGLRPFRPVRFASWRFIYGYDEGLLRTSRGYRALGYRYRMRNLTLKTVLLMCLSPSLKKWDYRLFLFRRRAMGFAQVCEDAVREDGYPSYIMSTRGTSRVNGSLPQTKICQFKLVLLGDMAVGKSSLVLRFVKGQFDEFQETTIGAAFLAQSVCLDDTTVKFEIWDTAGQERYHSLAPMYYRGAQAAIVVFDITKPETFERAKAWVKELQRQASPNIVIALAGNKADLADKRLVEYEVIPFFL